MMRSVIWYAVTRRTAAPSARRPAALAVVLLALLALLGCVVGPAAPAIAGGGPPGGDRDPFAGAAAAAADPADPADPAPAATDAAVPDPDLPGPWQIGYRTVRIVDSSRPGRVLVTSLWYPARPNTAAAPGSALPGPAGPAGAAGAAGVSGMPGTTGATGVNGPSGGPRAAAEPGAGGACPEVTSAGPAGLGGLGRSAFYPLVGNVGLSSASAVTDAAPAPGPFPLVVFSHGSVGSRIQSAFLMEALASHGFLVAAPDHPGDTMADAAAGREKSQLELAMARPRDVSAVIDALTATSCADAARVRPDQIGIVGFSFGGFTAVVSSIADLPTPADARIRASVGISAMTSPLPAASLAQVRVPTLLIGGTRDGAVPIPGNIDRAFKLLINSHPRMTVVITGAAHNSFTEICRQAGLLGAAGIPARLGMQVALTSAATCWPPQIAPADAHRLADRYTVAFLALHLRGESGYARYLTTPDAGDARLATVRSSP